MSPDSHFAFRSGLVLCALLFVFLGFATNGMASQDAASMKETHVEPGTRFEMIAQGQPFWNRVDKAIQANRVMLIGLAMVIPGILLVEAARQKAKRNQGESTFQPNWLVHLVPRWLYLFSITVVVLGGLAIRYFEQMKQHESTAEEYRSKVVKLTNEFYRATLTDPQPSRLIHPGHPPRLGGVYFRGNDERHPDLFNGGFYQTARIELFLADANDKRIMVGDKFDPDGTCFVVVEIQRAPKASPGLFAPSVMSKVFLSSRNPGRDSTENSGEPVAFEVVDPLETWTAKFPLKTEQDQNQTGRVFLYVGDAKASPFRAIAHYGIQYQLNIQKGRLQSSSELWMGAIYIPKYALVPQSHQVSISQWFDFRPIPEVREQNSTDPKLIGSDQYDGSDR